MKKIKEKHNASFAYTTGHSDLTQLQHTVNINKNGKDIVFPYLKQKKKEEEKIISKINGLGKDFRKNSNLDQVIHHFNALVKQVNNSEQSETVYQTLQVWREKISSKIIEEHKSYGKQIQQILNSPEKLAKALDEIDFKDDTSSVLADNIATIIERTKNADILKVLAQKKEEAYGVWDYSYKLRGLEESFAQKKIYRKNFE